MRTPSSAAGSTVAFRRSCNRRSQPGRISAAAEAICRASTATSADDLRARIHATRRSCAAHCSASVVFPYPAPATSIRTRARDRSSARISRGRSRMRRRRSGGFGIPAISLTGEATTDTSIEREGARGTPGVASRGRCRQTPGRRYSGPRLAESGSSPVSTLNATGICRRRLTPSFERNVSECAFAVRDEIPSRSPTSSFEHPAAISVTTSRCRNVRPAPL